MFGKYITTRRDQQQNRPSPGMNSIDVIRCSSNGDVIASNNDDGAETNRWFGVWVPRSFLKQDEQLPACDCHCGYPKAQKRNADDFVHLHIYATVSLDIERDLYRDSNGPLMLKTGDIVKLNCGEGGSDLPWIGRVIGFYQSCTSRNFLYSRMMIYRGR
jgi:hypothetical protein